MQVLLLLFGAVLTFSQTPLSDMSSCSNQFYRITRISRHFGAFVSDFNISAHLPLSDELVSQIKKDVHEYRLVVFKNQGIVSGNDQVAFSRQLGLVESTFYKHPRSPHPDIFRVSNDKSEGCTGVGRTGWHIDGTFQPKPFKYQTMHFHSICDAGETWFMPLHEFYESQDEHTKKLWDKLWMITGRGNYAHPLVYIHPTRGDTAMVFHCGPPFCSGWGYVDPSERANTTETTGGSNEVAGFSRVFPAYAIQDELTLALESALGTIGLRVQWEVGDLGVCDNLALAHYAAPGTQNTRVDAGLRILHRTTIAGEDIPTKADGRSSFIFE